jgi:tetratricopeptide (TPR) repeat protein
MTALMVNLHNQEMDEKVAAYFDEAIKKNWDSVNFLNAISWTVAVEKEIEKLYPSAIAAAKRALELYRHPAMLETLARLYALSGDYDKAFESIDEAMTIDPGNKRYENTCAKITKMKEG